jgi:hypothetical protein
MRCAQAHKLIGDQLENTISAPDKAKLDEHLEKCPDCRALLADFQRITQGARELPKHEPSARVWTGILAGVGLSGRQPGRGRAMAPGWAERFFLTGRARTAWAAALLLAMVAGGVLIGTRIGRNAGPATPLSADVKHTVAQLEDAENHYMMAIQALEEAIKGRVAELDPVLFAAFARNLGAIDGAIRQCRDALDKNPADLTARAYLLDAYKDKVEFLGDMIDVTKKPASAKPAGAQIL